MALTTKKYSNEHPKYKTKNNKNIKVAKVSKAAMLKNILKPNGYDPDFSVEGIIEYLKLLEKKH